MTKNDPPCAYCRLPRDEKHIGHRYTEAKVTTPKIMPREPYKAALADLTKRLNATYAKDPHIPNMDFYMEHFGLLGRKYGKDLGTVMTDAQEFGW